MNARTQFQLWRAAACALALGWVAGAPAAVTLESLLAEMTNYAAGVRPAPPFGLGTFVPRDGKFQLRVEVDGANPASQGARYYWGLDCVILEKP